MILKVVLFIRQLSPPCW